MGEPVKIVDLAVDLVRISGLSPQDIEIVFTGIRPGEKLYEELYLNDEKLLPSQHPKLHVVAHRKYSPAEVANCFKELATIVHESDSVIRRTLQEMVLEYIESQDDAEKRVVSPMPSTATRTRLDHSVIDLKYVGRTSTS